MADLESASRRWEDMETDVLVKIFKELNIIELTSVALVCHAWRSACSDPLLWKNLDLGLLKSNFIQTTASPYVWVDSRSDRRLMNALSIAMALSQGTVSCLVFHFNLYMKNEHLKYIAERCPHLKRLVMPAWNRITETGICNAVQIWKELESLTMPGFAYPPYIMEEIGISCKNFSHLKIMGSFDLDSATAIATNLPNLKVLSIRCSILTKEALSFIVDRLDRLEVLNISHCLFLEGVSPTGERVFEEMDESIGARTARVRNFYHCQSNSCITCERMKKDDGLMRWYKYGEWHWREDEVTSLGLGDYGKLFDEGCLELGFLEIGI